MDFVGRPWCDVEQQLKAANRKYCAIITRPSLHNNFNVDFDKLYVVRQHINADKNISIVLCAKMGKEV